MGVFLELVEQIGVEIVMFLVVWVNLSVVVVVDVYMLMCDVIVCVIEGGCDVILLDLYGVMVVENVEDGEGMLFECICCIVFDMFMVVVLDLYGNVMQKMVMYVDVIVSFKIYLYIDMFEIGEYVGCLLLVWLQGKLQLMMVWCQVLVFLVMLISNILVLVMQCVVEVVKVVEQEVGVLVVLVLVGFLLLDFCDVGMLVVVVIENDIVLVDVVVECIVWQIWNECDDFVYDSLLLVELLVQVCVLSEGLG